MPRCFVQGKTLGKIFLGILLLIQCVGCGSTSGVPTRPTASSTAAGTASPSSQNPGRSLDIPGLLHISEEAPVCPLSHNAPQLPGGGHVVLATDRLTYDSAEIQQMRDYFAHGFSSPLPSTLAYARVVLTDAVPSWGLLSADSCEIGLQMTNVGKEVIQVTQIRMKLTADPQPINHHYRLINACSFLPGEGCGGPGEGGEKPHPYDYKLGPAHANAIFQGQPEGEQPVLNPGDTLAFTLIFYPRDTSGYLEYSLMPELVLSTANTKEQVFDLPQLTSTISFIGADHFSCYELHGNTFVPIPPSTVRPSDLPVNCL